MPSDIEDVGQPEPPATPVHLANLARRIGIPPEFLFHVVNEPDDWTFVLKVHALIETALTDTLMRHLRQPALDGKIRKLTLNTKARVGRDPEAYSCWPAEFR